MLGAVVNPHCFKVFGPLPNINPASFRNREDPNAMPSAFSFGDQLCNVINSVVWNQLQKVRFDDVHPRVNQKRHPRLFLHVDQLAVICDVQCPIGNVVVLHDGNNRQIVFAVVVVLFDFRVVFFNKDIAVGNKESLV